MDALNRSQMQELNRLDNCLKRKEHIVTEFGRLRRELIDLDRYPKPLTGAVRVRAEKVGYDLAVIKTRLDEFKGLCPDASLPPIED